MKEYIYILYLLLIQRARSVWMEITANGTLPCLILADEKQPLLPFLSGATLEFCKQHSYGWSGVASCCHPVTDEEVAKLFENFFDRGRGCPTGIRGSVRQRSDRFMQWMCLTCDPNQGKYTTENGTVMVCETFAHEMYQGKGVHGLVSDWENCGLRVPNICVDDKPYPGTDRFDCGDGIIAPLKFWANRTEMFADPTIRPYMFDNMDFVVVPDGTKLENGNTCFAAAFAANPSLFHLVLLALAMAWLE